MVSIYCNHSYNEVMNMRNDIIERKEEILQWINKGQSKASMARELNCKPETLNRYLENWGITYNGNQSGKGTIKTSNRGMDLMTYLAESKDIQTNKIRRKLLEEGYKEYKCECCGNTEWMGRPIPLEVHHKDGDRNNNTLENFELLCPNCHAFTDSYRGKNSRINP